MKSIIRKSTYQAIYRLLNRVSPIDGDCGLLCGNRCCICDDAKSGKLKDVELGMYLLPGEDKVYTRREDWLAWNVDPAEECHFPESWRGGVYFVRCLNPPHCVRSLRPLQCRTFPLAPYITKDGYFHLILDTSPLPYTCPLVAERAPLNTSFITATYTAWKRLISDPLIYDLVALDSKDRGSDIIIMI